MKSVTTLLGNLFFINYDNVIKFLKMFNFSTLESIYLRNALTVHYGHFPNQGSVFKVSFSDFDSDLGYDKELVYKNESIPIIEKLRCFP